MTRRRILPALGITLIPFGLMLLFVQLSVGSLKAVRPIDTIGIRFSGMCENEGNKNSCEMAYEFRGRQYRFNASSGATIPLPEIEENAWSALFEVPLHTYDRMMCGTLRQGDIDPGSVFVRFDVTQPKTSLLTVHDHACIPVTEAGKPLFRMRAPALLGIEFSREMEQRVVDILSHALLGDFREGTIDTAITNDMTFFIDLTSELSHPEGLKVIYVISFILALHITVLVMEFGSFIRACCRMPAGSS